jgi:hypothetical protein
MSRMWKLPMDWEFDKANENLSEVVARALSDGPQRIRLIDRSVILIAPSRSSCA